MIMKTFEATVAGGRLEHSELLNEFEGCRVQVTVTREGAAPQRDPEQPASADAVADDEAPEPPQWLEVEKDVYVPMRGRIEVLADAAVVEERRARPTLIFPEDLPDD